MTMSRVALLPTCAVVIGAIAACNSPIATYLSDVGIIPGDAIARAAAAPLTPERLGLGELRIGAPADRLNALTELGTPTRDREQPHANYDHYREIDYGPDLTVAIADGEIAMLLTRTAAWPTPDGLRVGDSLQKAINLYGSPSGEPWGDENVTYVSYEVPGGAFLTLQVQRDRIVSLHCGWLPD